MLAARAERAPLLQRGKITKGVNAPKADTLAASAMRQARRGLGVFGVALALSGVVVAMMAAPDAGTKKRAARVLKLTARRALPKPILNFFFLSYFFAVGSKYYENKSFHSPSARQDIVL